MSNNQQGWIGVDLDGTLAFYDEWRGPQHIGEPIPKMAERVRAWIAEGRDVRIFTARAEVINSNPSPSFFGLDARQAIESWSLKHLGKILPITATKDLNMAELWDDRAVQVIPNTGVALRDFIQK